jgi:hypothetical protein
LAELRVVVETMFAGLDGLQLRQIPEDFPPYPTVQAPVAASQKGWAMVGPTAGMIDSQSANIAKGDGSRSYDRERIQMSKQRPTPMGPVTSPG